MCSYQRGADIQPTFIKGGFSEFKRFSWILLHVYNLWIFDLELLRLVSCHVGQQKDLRDLDNLKERYLLQWTNNSKLKNEMHKISSKQITMKTFFPFLFFLLLNYLHSSSIEGVLCVMVWQNKKPLSVCFRWQSCDIGSIMRQRIKQSLWLSDGLMNKRNGWD